MYPWRVTDFDVKSSYLCCLSQLMLFFFLVATFFLQKSWEFVLCWMRLLIYKKYNVWIDWLCTSCAWPLDYMSWCVSWSNLDEFQICYLSVSMSFCRPVYIQCISSTVVGCRVLLFFDEVQSWHGKTNSDSSVEGFFFLKNFKYVLLFNY